MSPMEEDGCFERQANPPIISRKQCHQEGKGRSSQVSKREDSSRRARSAQHRRMEILETVFRTSRQVRTRDLAERFGIGQNLLANDLNYLEDLGQIERGHGWIRRRVTGVGDLFLGTEFSTRTSQGSAEKAAIARYVAEQLPARGEFLLDAGSTSLAIGERLIRRDVHPLIHTNNLPLAMLLATQSALPVQIVGGKYSRDDAATTGEETGEAIEGRMVDAGVLTPRAMSFITPTAACATGWPGAVRIRSRLSQMAKEQGESPEACASRDLYLALFSMDSAQHAFKANLIRNSRKLYICGDASKLSAVGRCFFTTVISAWLPATRAAHTDMMAVRTRGPVQLQHARMDAEEIQRAEASLENPADFRQPDTIEIVTSTDADGKPPSALGEFLRSLPGKSVEHAIELLKAVVVVVDPSGCPVPTDDWIGPLQDDGH